MNPMGERKRTHDQAFRGPKVHCPAEPAKRTKLERGCEELKSRDVIKSAEPELIDLCSESSGSYKTAHGDSGTQLNGFSDISPRTSSIQSSTVLDLSSGVVAFKKKRFSTITVSSNEADAAQNPGTSSSSSKTSSKFRSNPTNAELNLQMVCLLGTGGYGKVFLVRTKESLEIEDKTSESSTESGIHLESTARRSRTPRRKRAKKVQYVRNSDSGCWIPSPRKDDDPFNYYALKVIKKSSVLKSATDLRHLKMERRILSRVQNPFIVQCYMAAQTEKQLFFLSEYIQGGELFNLLDRFAPLSEPDSLFYMSEILVAIEYLHSLGIIYRDLKPENIMLSHDGHVKLVDFGLSRDDFPVGPFDEVATATKCGTREYMAPEVFRKEKYGYVADWWSYGAVSYDLMTNRVPIFDQNYDVPITFPSTMSFVAKDLLERLMNVDSKSRIGCVLGANAICRHPFFNPVNFDDVRAKKLKPPFILSALPDPGDFSCFSKKVTSTKRRVCSESQGSFIDPAVQYHFENFDSVVGCDFISKKK